MVLRIFGIQLLSFFVMIVPVASLADIIKGWCYPFWPGFVSGDTHYGFALLLFLIVLVAGPAYALRLRSTGREPHRAIRAQGWVSVVCAFLALWETLFFLAMFITWTTPMCGTKARQGGCQETR